MHACSTYQEVGGNLMAHQQLEPICQHIVVYKLMYGIVIS